KVYLSTGTVKNYITSIYNKVGVSNRTAAVLLLKKLF
ncbi:LuxR C-terminal-related transcriptional regulator, partial [Clostridium chrysemydis]